MNSLSLVLFVLRLLPPVVLLAGLIKNKQADSAILAIPVTIDVIVAVFYAMLLIRITGMVYYGWILNGVMAVAVAVLMWMLVKKGYSQNLCVVLIMLFIVKTVWVMLGNGYIIENLNGLTYNLAYAAVLADMYMNKNKKDVTVDRQ